MFHVILRSFIIITWKGDIQYKLAILKFYLFIFLHETHEVNIVYLREADECNAGTTTLSRLLVST